MQCEKERNHIHMTVSEVRFFCFHLIQEDSVPGAWYISDKWAQVSQQ